MRTLTLSAFLLATAALAADPPAKPIPGLKAAQDAYDKELLIAKELHSRSTKEARAEYVKALKAIQTERTKAGDLDGAIKVKEMIAGVEGAEPADTGSLRKKLAGTVWGWEAGQPHTITLKGDGTLSMTWSPTGKGFWHINPDGSVIVIGDSQMGGIMKFNRDLTAHVTVFPETKVVRGGPRIK